MNEQQEYSTFVPPSSRLADIDPTTLTVALGAVQMMLLQGKTLEAVARRLDLPPASVAGLSFRVGMALAQEVAPALKDVIPEDDVSAENLREVLAINAIEEDEASRTGTKRSIWAAREPEAIPAPDGSRPPLSTSTAHAITLV
ncbi:hypothetical protein U8607_18435 [Methylobacterium durans]|uniref:hypothetical protein n=1 Tax=Methylobacterium durans TaxID=2202825 RepID=UPI002AFFEB63|nr:hypothetical protein [Methylobacterium durans]MEA1834071.1 hypothetical protein [Methylobacterium durans]